MTAFRDLLNDEELAAVLTFVRNSWGNKSDPVDATAVARIRSATEGRFTVWTPKELTDAHPLEVELMAEVDRQPEVEFSNDALEKELMSESTTAIAAQAIAEGNALRGKKVFYESAAACYACHDPPGRVARLGPDLTRLKTRLTNEQLVDSILRPAELIEKEYAQVSVLTVDGQIFTGIRVSENDDELVLRNLANPKPVVIAQDDIEQVKDSKTSLMPANLVKQLKSRQEFDDLMKYVIEVRRR